jgi:putative flippase GtrA
MLDFGIVGVINTLIDFIILNILAVVLGFPRLPSNIVSTSIAAGFSFFANKRVVFGSKSKNYRREIVMFLLVTFSGLYILQTIVIYLIADLSNAPGNVMYRLVELLHLDGLLSRDAVITNVAKLAATILTMVWNYILYKKYVFHDASAPTAAERSSDA